MLSARSLGFGVFGLSLLTCWGCGAEDDRGVAGPTGYSQVEPEPPGEGGAGGGGSATSDGDIACGELDWDCCEGGSCAEGLACAEDGTCQVASESAPPAPEPAPAECGQAGQACCATGDACPGALGKAQCCTGCSGAPDFNCQCGEALQTGGSCKLCCVVCKDGHLKVGALEVGEGQTCQTAAADWCQQNRGVGAETTSGWKNDCG